MRTYIPCLGLLLLGLYTSPAAARVALPDDDRSVAPHFVIDAAGTDADAVLPLRSTHADVKIAGVVAQVRVTQRWQNDSATPIEATYVFPSSTRAAVFGMRMKIGDRVLHAKIDKRAAAQKLYERARDEGKTASLLTQERANVFVMRVANIMPGDVIDVELDYNELLVPTDGIYELVYPAVVGPRFVPDAGAQQREPWLANPFLKADDPRVPQWDVDVAVSAGMPIRSVGSPSHGLTPRYDGPTRVAIDVDGAAGGDRDFIFRYRLAGDAIETGVLLFRGKRDKENFFLLMMQPPQEVAAEDMPPREIVFVVDVSGSMNGFPLDTSKQLMEELLATLRPQDRFNLLFFAGSSHLLSERSLPATPQNVDRAKAAFRDQLGRGGTLLGRALKRVLELPTDTRTTSRSIVLLTDGYVNSEDDVFDLIRNKRREANVFAFGIGRSVNRLLIEGVARAGVGRPFVVTDSSEARAKATALHRLVSRPALTHIRVRYQGFSAYDVEPGAPADLFVDRPLVLFGKFRGPSAGRIRVEGVAGGRAYKKTLVIEDNHERPTHAPLRHLWARERISRLDELGTPSEADVDEVTRLGLRYNLLTRYTSFVAVDPRVRNGTAGSRHVTQPAVAPKGVNLDPVLDYQPPSPPATRRRRQVLRSAPRPSGKPVPRQQRKCDPVLELDCRPVDGAKRQLGASDVLTVIKKNLGSVKRCGAEHQVNGVIKLEWRILKSGRTSSVRVLTPEHAGTPVGACLQKAVKRWRFPAFTGSPPPPVKFPFKLKGNGRAKATR